MKIIIVGGVAGGMSAATRLRRLMEDGEIVIFEKGPFVSFANCCLIIFLVKLPSEMLSWFKHPKVSRHVSIWMCVLFMRW